MAPLADRVRAALDDLGVAADDRVVVAVSGGVDSMTLLHLLVEIGQPLVAVHVDHGLRADSAEDAAFVRSECSRLGTEVEVIEVTVAQGNVQARAREARYDVLVEVTRRRRERWVATAHTATDQAETVLMALARGAGLRGMAGMPPRRALTEGVDLIRPLLQCSKQEVRAEARSRAWAWREDSSNARPDYLRNRLRHTVLPSLEAEAPGVDLRIAASAADARAALRLGAALGEDGEIALGVMAALPESACGLLVSEALAYAVPEARRSRALVDRVVALVDAEVGARVESGGVRVWRERDRLRIESSALNVPMPGILDTTPLDAVPASFPADPFTEVVDLDRVKGAAVRLWTDGDRLRPLGMDGSARVSDLLRDRGVPPSERSAVPVVVRGGDVLWVVGHRLSAEAAVGPGTRRAARWTWRPGAG